MWVLPKPLIPLTADCILQQTIANAEQMKDIGERVESLSELLTSPVGDQDTGEKTRRTALREFVFPLQSCTNTFLNQLVYVGHCPGLLSNSNLCQTNVDSRSF